MHKHAWAKFHQYFLNGQSERKKAPETINEVKINANRAPINFNCLNKGLNWVKWIIIMILMIVLIIIWI